MRGAVFWRLGSLRVVVGGTGRRGGVGVVFPMVRCGVPQCAQHPSVAATKVMAHTQRDIAKSSAVWYNRHIGSELRHAIRCTK